MAKGTNQVGNATNRMRLEDLERQWTHAIVRMLRVGFYGRTTICIKVADGVIQHVSADVTEVLRSDRSTGVEVDHATEG